MLTPTLHEKLQEREDSVPPAFGDAIRQLDAAIRRDLKPRRYQRLKVGHARPYRSRLDWMRARRRGRA